jgi:hypothetical protein
MTSAINVTTIDATVPAVDAELLSQPLRDNFAGIKTALTTAKSEIETLQSTVTTAQAADTGTLNAAKSYANSIIIGLQTALGFTPENSSNKDVSGGYVGKTLEKINIWNTARTFVNYFVSATTAARTWTFPDKDGTVAMTSDLPAYTPENSSNKDVSGGYVGKTLEKINVWNTARTFLSFFVSAATAARTWTLPDASGTFALTEDTHNSSAKTTPVDADELGLFDSETGYILKKISFLNLKLTVTNWNNPIGTIREFNVSTNPATLLGFGTWTAHGTGRTTVAIDAGQAEFATLGQTGGAKTHLLTSAESGLPAHNHPLGNGGNVISSGSADAGIPASGSFFRSTTIGNNTAANASVAHNNLQPYIVTYRWVRTA